MQFTDSCKVIVVEPYYMPQFINFRQIILELKSVYYANENCLV